MSFQRLELASSPSRLMARPTLLGGARLLLALSCVASAPGETNEEFGERLSRNLADYREQVEAQKRIPQRPPASNNDSPTYSNSGSSSDSSDDAEQEARRERNARYRAVIDAAVKAHESGDYQEALRLCLQQQQLRDGPVVRAAIAGYQAYFAESESLATWRDAIALDKNGDFEAALASYQRAIDRYPSRYDQQDLAYVKGLAYRVESEKARQAALREAAERERLHRPEVERLRQEARALMAEHPAEAKAKLDAARKLIPGDRQMSMEWHVVDACLLLERQDYDAALAALDQASLYSADAAEIAAMHRTVKESRDKQGADVRVAFGELRSRMGATKPGAFGSVEADPILVSDRPAGTDKTSAKPGDQLVSAGFHGDQAAQAPENGQASKVFDTVGDDHGSVDTSGIATPSATAPMPVIPPEMKNDLVITETLRQLDTWAPKLKKADAAVEQAKVKVERARDPSAKVAAEAELATAQGTSDGLRVAVESAKKTIETRKIYLAPFKVGGAATSGAASSGSSAASPPPATSPKPLEFSAP